MRLHSISLNFKIRGDRLSPGATAHLPLGGELHSDPIQAWWTLIIRKEKGKKYNEAKGDRESDKRQAGSREGACQVARSEVWLPLSNKVVTSNGVLMRMHWEDKNKLWHWCIGLSHSFSHSLFFFSFLFLKHSLWTKEDGLDWSINLLSPEVLESIIHGPIRLDIRGARITGDTENIRQLLARPVW